MPYARSTIYARLARRVERGGPDECWLWTGAQGGGGAGSRYGVIGSGGKYGTNRYVHRVAYEEVHGPIPAGMTIDHVAVRGCKSRLCCNPAHLEAVSLAVNIRRGQSPLDDADVARIRAETLLNQRELAELYGVDPSTISRIRSGATWT